MKRHYADDTLWVRARHGGLRQLFVFEERRNAAGPDALDNCRRWARDEAGRWYAFSDFGDALVESLSGDWLAIVGAPVRRRRRA
jgi:hypothetical protein